jgi:hypothetical protein
MEEVWDLKELLQLGVNAKLAEPQPPAEVEDLTYLVDVHELRDGGYLVVIYDSNGLFMTRKVQEPWVTLTATPGSFIVQ